MSALADILKRRIAQNGPISLAEYMAECLLHPEHGYYATRDPLGKDGDFTTAPEISQMFGELLGLSLAQSWLDQGAPNPFILAELGPGRGTLMADMLRATKSVPGFHAAMQVCLIEASPVLRDVQRQTLSDYTVSWAQNLSDLNLDKPLFLIANEFFDALPVRQFTREKQMWRETQVGLQDNDLRLGLGTPAPLAHLAARLADTKDGDVVETCLAAAPITAEIAQCIAAHGGAAIFVDYGDWHSLGDTFQALENHAPVDPLARPGAADLTAHVDFETLSSAAKEAGAAATHMITQRDLLGRLGIGARAQVLADSLNAEALEAHVGAFKRLTSEEEMGTLFKALAIFPQNGPVPPGFDAGTNTGPKT